MIAERCAVLDPEHRSMEIADLGKEKTGRRSIPIGSENLCESGGASNGARETTISVRFGGILRFFV